MKIAKYTPKDVLIAKLSMYINEKVNISGMVHRVRILSKVVFVELLDSSKVVQCVIPKNIYVNCCSTPLNIGDWINIEGVIREELRVKDGIELHTNKMKILSKIARKNNVEDVSDSLRNNRHRFNLGERALSLKNLEKRSAMKIKGVLEGGLTDFFISSNFTQINSPKIIFKGLEGGANLFKIAYFGRDAYLSQSPQLYKQMMVGVFQRLFEVGPVFRANENKGSKQLVEFIALDVELAPIENVDETISWCLASIKHCMDFLVLKCKFETGLLGVNIPNVENVPMVTYTEALKLLGKSNFEINQDDEELLSKILKDSHDADFYFLCNPPLNDCNFYFMEDENILGFGKCWHLIFRGMNIGGGGQRIHSYEMQKERMEDLGMDINDFEHYLLAHQCGLPPHGGFTVGIERFVMQLLNISNIKDVSLFPRDSGSRI